MDRTKVRIAVDIGGTFTDGVGEVLPGGEIVVAKELTTYSDPSTAVTNVIGELLRQAQTVLRLGGGELECVEVVHGTTLVTNAIIERKGAIVGLLATEGTSDVLDIGRETRYDMYDLDIVFPEPLVPSTHRFEITERLNGKGDVVRALDETTVVSAIDSMKTLGVQAVAVSCLHAYMNSDHERRIEEILHENFPDVSISLSSRVASEIGEYERTSTTVANAFVQPLAMQYINRLKERMAEHSIDAPLRIMTSNGGFTSDESACAVPIDILESGPAGGVRSAINTAASLGIDDILTFDMGGTTAKACVCLQGEPELTYSFEAARVTRFKKGSGLPILTPSIDLIEIGAGGGSIAFKSNLGLLNVGPESASSEPGPACYGLGGKQPTVTDADLILGYLAADAFLGGKMQLDTAAAEVAIEALSRELGLSMIDTAWGIHNVVSENMAAAARVHIAEKGLDPRNLTMVATGGAGPVHAVEVAAKLGIGHVIFTIAAGVGSCLGFLAAPARIDRSWSYLEKIDQLDKEKVRSSIGQLEAEIAEDIGRSNIGKEDAVWSLGVEIRYAGQGHSILVTLPYRGISDDLFHDLYGAFVQRYQAIYGTVIKNGIPQTVTWRLTAQSSTDLRRFSLLKTQEKTTDTGMIGSRKVFVATEKEHRDVPIYQRYSVPPGTQLQGPLILQEDESTIVVARPAEVEVLKDGTVSVKLK